MDKNIVVLDVGKTFSKLSLWDGEGKQVARAAYANQSIDEEPFRALDIRGIETWMTDTLRDFSSLRTIHTIIPVAHGAADAIVRDGKCLCPVLDYECPIPEDIRNAYESERDDFRLTGSPRLPDGLNLGAQLYWLASLYPECFTPDATIITYPQYWSWLLTGVEATEITSLGCHTDLWFPKTNEPSRLAESLGWAAMLAPMHRADDVLGTLSPKWVKLTGLPAATEVLCGIHDSNASLLGSRGFEEIGDKEFTTLSTGTWFVAMRSPERDAACGIDELPESRDCLVNVDVNGNLVPSARFMGGREIALLTGEDYDGLDDPSRQDQLLEATARVVDSNSRILPAFCPGVGPFPDIKGRWDEKPEDPNELRAAVCLYTALVTNTSLTLIRARERVLIEGRFCKAEVFVRALATLRPDIQFFVSDVEHDVSYRALSLLDNDAIQLDPLRHIKPLDFSLDEYAADWQAAVDSHSLV